MQSSDSTLQKLRLLFPHVGHRWLKCANVLSFLGKTGEGRSWGKGQLGAVSSRTQPLGHGSTNPLKGAVQGICSISCLLYEAIYWGANCLGLPAMEGSRNMNNRIKQTTWSSYLFCLSLGTSSPSSLC